MSKNQFKILSKDAINDSILENILSIEEKYFQDSSYSRNDLIELINSNNHHFYLIFNEDIFVGYCIYALIGNEAEIYKIFIIEKYRKQGIGKEIINKIYFDNNIKKIFVDLNENNKIGKLFYEKLEFNEINNRKKYYKDGSNSITLLKKYE